MKIDLSKLHYSDEDYNCPNCGHDGDDCEGTDHYSLICPSCGTEFETPDV